MRRRPESLPWRVEKRWATRRTVSASRGQKRLTNTSNESKRRRQSLLKFLTYFWVHPWMIEAAVILSGVLRHWPDFFIILSCWLRNGVVGSGRTPGW